MGNNTISGEVKSKDMESFREPVGLDGLPKKEEEISFEDVMECWPTNRSRFEALVKVAGKNNLVPLIGAGITKQLTIEKDFLSWKELFYYIAKEHGFSGNELSELSFRENEFDYEDAGEKVESIVGPGELQDFLRDLFSPKLLDDEKIRNSPLRFLPRLKPPIILTTNYDTAIERAFELFKSNEIMPYKVITPSTTTREFVHYFKVQDTSLNLKTIIYKFHGDAGDENNTHDLILSKSSYDKAYGTIQEIENRTTNKDVVRNLYTLLFAKTILFLGSSLQDDRIIKLLKANAEGEHYAIVPVKNDNEAVAILKRVKETNILPIFFPSGKWKCIDIVLEELVKLNTAWDIASVCPTKEAWLEDYLSRLEKKEVAHHIVFFGGIFTKLREKESRISECLIRWAEEHKAAKLFFCYDAGKVIENRLSQLKDHPQMSAEDKIERIKNIPMWYPTCCKGRSKARIVPIYYDLNGYAIVMDQKLFWNFKTHERSSQSPIIELDLKQNGNKKFIDYMRHALRQSFEEQHNNPNYPTSDDFDDNVKELFSIIDGLDKDCESSGRVEYE